jgi:signal transduction histidine kinase
MRGDKQRLVQIVLNIVGNACKFTDEGDIHIRARQQDGSVLIAISDTGPGIALADQAAVFEPFQQTKTGLRQGGGTGLGMPIAKSLAEAHGGRLWLESEVDKGTTFFVSLPIKSDALQPTFA